MNLDEVLKRFQNVHNNEYIYSEVKYVNQYTKVKIGHKHYNGIYWFEQNHKDH